MMNKILLTVVAVVALVARDAPVAPDAPDAPVAPVAPAPVSPWKQAIPGYVFSFPRDHAAHPDFKIEWWYYTGNVKAADGRRFGYQVTFFRVGIDYAPANPSKWAVRDLYMTHLAVSDAQGQRYRYAEKLTRGGPGLAGAKVDTYYTWNEDWSAGLTGNREPGTGNRHQHALKAADKHVGIDLLLDEGKVPAINGINGINQKGAREGNASHYYSLTRMPTTGTLMIEGERFEVSGLTWMDHEFSTSFLEPEQRGWDWFSIQLSDNRELMLYRMRRADNRGPRDADFASRGGGGSHDPRSSGTLIDANGRTTHLSNDDFTLTPGRSTFKSTNGAVYPTEWTVSIPSHKIVLTVTTPLSDQELSLVESTGIAYWEGMIDVTGRSGGQAVTGSGYLEMTGYHSSLGRILTGS
jgi:predicted secreted hydrolase